MNFQPGDIVELVRGPGFTDIHGWNGRVVVFARYQNTWLGRAAVVVPMPPGVLGFRPECLRKIEPPDWQAPELTREDIPHDAT